MNLTHGGDVAGFALAYGRPPLDFSASLNPFGMPPGILAAARRAVEDSTPYPDPLCRELTASLAKRLGVYPGAILCGNGAADVIFRLVQSLRPRTALLPVPAFAEYELALRSVECAVMPHPMREEADFRLEADILPRIVPGVDILFLCQPNNPTGQLIDPALLDAVLARCRETGTRLALDECFLCFVPEAERRSLLRRVADCRELFILGSFTKLYGMAGIRLGYGVSGDAGLIERMRAAGQPWPVSTIAQAAGLAALDEEAFVERTLRAIETEKAYLLAEFARLGLRVLGSRANYLFFHADRPDLVRRLAEAGILIRDCANFKGLRPGYYRVAVRLREENVRLIEAMELLQINKFK